MGRRVDDHSFWAGSSSKDSPLPMKSGMKHLSSVEGAGAESNYPDMEDKIKGYQEKQVSKIKSQGLKDGYRN